ncbi:sulfotransferase [uncultured Tateyamaria sp.]|uniref:sulfotransferase n=1 Tax=uncultured Tateyamaria sp. TaxID=455651 RepID=UPI00262430EB|nr:sulfotransferase [uncultured Tateyamaria sp.]
MQTPKPFDKLFLSIGAMKAGTTWLYAVLGRHPELHFAMEKEIHYFYHRFVKSDQLSEKRRLKEAHERYMPRFDPETSHVDVVRQNLRWIAAYLDRPVDDLWYRNLFQLRDHETYACDFSNLNAHLPAEAWPRISESCQQLRVLYTLRDPVKRLWSHTKFHLEVTGAADKLDTWGARDFEAFLRQPHIWDNAEYGAVLRRVRAGLQPSQFKAIFYEDLHADQRGTLAEIEGFLGVAPFAYPQALLERRFTESVKRPMPDFFPRLIAKDVARITAEVEAEGYRIPDSWRH